MIKKLIVFLTACAMVLPGVIFAGTMSVRAASAGVIAVEAFTVNGDFVLPPTSFSSNGRSVAQILNDVLGYDALNYDPLTYYGSGVNNELRSVRYSVSDAVVRTEISNEAKTLGITIKKAPAYADSAWLQNNDFADGSRWKLVVNDKLMSAYDQALNTYYPSDNDVVRLCFSVDGLGQDLAISNSPMTDVFTPANRDALYRSMAEYADMVNDGTILGDSYDDYVLGVARDLSASASTLSEANLIMQDMIGNPNVVESIEDANSDGAEEPAETDTIEPDNSDDTTYDPDDPTGTTPDESEDPGDTEVEWELMDYSVIMDGEYVTDATDEYLIIQVREYPDGRTTLDGKTNTAGAAINLTALKVSGAPYNLEDAYGELAGTRERDQAGYVDPYAADEGEEGEEEEAAPDPWTFNLIQLDDGRYAFADSNGNAVRDGNGQPLAYGNLPDAEDSSSYDPDDPDDPDDTTPDVDVLPSTTPPYTNGPTPPSTTIPSVPAAPTGVNAMFIIIPLAVVGGALLLGFGATIFGKIRHHR